jgi:peptidoglycan hydrolase CwlO-like protein
MTVKILNGFGKWLAIVIAMLTIAGMVWGFFNTTASQNAKISNTCKDVEAIKPQVTEHNTKIQLLEKDIGYIKETQTEIKNGIESLGHKIDRQRPNP